MNDKVETEPLDRASDPLDRGSELALLFNASAIADAQWKARPEQERNADGTWPTTECKCGEPIEPERLEMGKILCFYCQNELERKGKQYAQRRRS